MSSSFARDAQHHSKDTDSHECNNYCPVDELELFCTIITLHQKCNQDKQKFFSFVFLPKLQTFIELTSLYQVVQKSVIPVLVLRQLPQMYSNFSNFFTVRTRNLRHIKVRLRRPPHLYFVTALPSKTQTTASINATCLIY